MHFIINRLRLIFGMYTVSSLFMLLNMKSTIVSKKQQLGVVTRKGKLSKILTNTYKIFIIQRIFLGVLHIAKRLLKGGFLLCPSL